MGKEVFFRIKSLLESEHIKFLHLEHEHVHRSEDAAKVRGNTIEQAAKAIVLKIKKPNSDSQGHNYALIMCVLSGHKKIDLKKIKSLLSIKSANLASPEEVLEATGCTIGSVPPFAPLFNMDLFVDKSITDQKEIFFSAGTHNDSIRMSSSDYVSVLKPRVIDFAAV
jgi:Ala-tRNA(Pro) deacylase